MVTQQPPEVLKPRKNQVLETEAKEKDEAVEKGGGVTKDIAEKVDTSTAQNTRHWSGTSREKKMILEHS